MYYTTGVCVVCGQSAGMHTWYCARGRALRGREARCARAERQSRRVLCAAQEYVNIIYELRLRRVWTTRRAAYVISRPRRRAACRPIRVPLWAVYYTMHSV